MVFTMPSPNITWLTETLATGGDVPLRDEVATKHLSAILRAKVSHVLDTRVERDDAEMWKVCGVKYLRAGTDDATGHHIPAEVFDKAVQFSKKAENGRLLVHCHMGVNRGPSVAAAVLMHRGMGAVDAFRLIRKERPVAAVYYILDAYDAHVQRTGQTPGGDSRRVVETELRRLLNDPFRLDRINEWVLWHQQYDTTDSN